MGVVEMEEVLRAEVLGVCRTYCLQVWNKTLNQAGVEASSTFRRVENVYYPTAIYASSPLSSSGPQADIVSKKADDDKDSPAKVLPSSTSPPKEVEQAKATENEKDSTKGAVPKATKPPAIPKDPSKDKKAF